MTTGPIDGFLDAVGELLIQPPSTDRVESFRVAEAVRTLTTLMSGRQVPSGSFDALLVALTHTNELLATLPRRVHVDQRDAAKSFLDFSPVAGEANVVAPPLRLTVGDDTKVLGCAQFEQQYEGPPGHVHGGVLSAAFDELLGMAQSLSGTPGMTGRLTIHYRRPTPLRVPVFFEGRVLNVSGRKITTAGTSSIDIDGERVVTAEAEGLFISIPPSAFAAMGGL
jgi:acyl-coenzyme A thioesterase PaaI-like protein